MAKPRIVLATGASLLSLIFPWPSNWALAQPKASTSANIKVEALVRGGGPYGPPESPLGNGLRFLANADANSKAGAASYAGAIAPEKSDVKSKTDPPGTRTDNERNTWLENLIGSAKDNEFNTVELNNENLTGFARADTGALTAEAGSHIARVLDNRLTAIRNDIVKSGGPSAEPQNVGSFEIRQQTSATALAEAASLSEAYAISRGLVSGIKLQNRFSNAIPTPPEFKPTMDLVWTISDLQIEAKPTYAKAFIRHQVLVNDTPIGFAILMEDGKITKQEYFEVPDMTNVKDWFDANAEQTGNQYKLKAGARPALTVNVPLGGELLVNQGILDVNLENQNFELSYEEPPLANIQVKEKSGCGGCRRESGDSGPMPDVHWDSSTGMLMFDDVPIDTLAGTGNGQGIDPQYASDPLINAYLHIDPMVYAFDDDGRKYFAGGMVSVTDGITTFLTAAVQSMVVDESLYELQQNNMFAVLTDPEFNLQAGSQWIQDYYDRFQEEGPLLTPQLFVSFNDRLLPEGGPDAFADSFDKSAAVFIGFCQGVPEPATITLVGFPLGLFFVKRGRRATWEDKWTQFISRLRCVPFSLPTG